MANRTRNHRLDYKKRIARGRARGLSLSQSRGHARAGERKKPKKRNVDPNAALERALERMKNGESQKSAAKAQRVSVEQLRRYLKENTRAKRRGNKWVIIDRRPVSMVIVSRGKFISIDVPYRSKGKVGRFWNAVNSFLETNDRIFLKPYENDGIRDANGKFHPWETDPNTLRKLDSIGELSFVDIYANVAQ